ncbi:MAG: 3-phosphoshikimate 1-carboxyvinyltransferase, partial [Bacteroidales bacterium]|nr:3-phosphoshikimate 1-carboxyvinyltransferase [Bacteroidales bacterium]
MQLQIYPATLSGAIKAPPSKSYGQRVLAASLLAKGTSVIRNPSRCNDAMSALSVIRQLGARIKDAGDHLIIKGGKNPKGQKLDCGEAGLCIRMFTAIAALYDKPMVMTGSGSLMNRPVDMVAKALEQLGVTCQTRDRYPPIWFKGPLQGGEVTIDGSLSSQLLSGLLMSLPVAPKDSVIQVDRLRSTPYIDMTLEVLKQFGIQVDAAPDYSLFRIQGRQTYTATDISVEGDWSGAAFFMVAGALTGKITVNGLSMDSAQADRAILQPLQQAGAQITELPDGITISADKPLRPFEFNAIHCPDLFPPLIVLAAHCKGTSKISGVQRLKYKESNRALVLQQELGKMGVPIRFDTENMYINGPAQIRQATIDPNGDHRIAMAAAITALHGHHPVTIDQSECVNKSYP